MIARHAFKGVINVQLLLQIVMLMGVVLDISGLITQLQQLNNVYNAQMVVFLVR